MARPKNWLSTKQKRFIKEYRIDGNATQAAIRSGYSEKTAQVIGSENLHKPLVRDAIAANERAIALKREVTVDSLVDEFEEARELRATHITARRNGFSVDEQS